MISYHTISTYVRSVLDTWHLRPQQVLGWFSYRAVVRLHFRLLVPLGDHGLDDCYLIGQCPNGRSARTTI